jgi:PKD repeat protein
MDNGTYTVAVRVTDDDGSTDIAMMTVTVNNVAPSVDAGPDGTINEGSAFSSAGSFTDPGADSWTGTVDYGDGSEVQPLSLNPDKTFAVSHLYAENGIYTVTVTVMDDDGGVGFDTLIVTVNNVAPTVDAGPDQTENEGDTVFFNGSFTDPGTLDTHTIEWDFGDGGTASDTLMPSHVYTDNGVYKVRLTVTDDDGGVGSDTMTVTVNNVAPVVDAGPDATINEGSAFSSAGSFTDPGADTWTATVDYGDGSGVKSLTLNADKTFDLSHTYMDDGVYTVTVTVTDDDGGMGSDTTAVTVNDLVPAAAFTWTPEPQTEGSVVSFTDTSTSSPDTITGWSWEFAGQGRSSEYNPGFAFLDHGTHTVTLTVTDEDGSTDTVSHPVTVTDLGPTALLTGDTPLNEGDTGQCDARGSTSYPDAIDGYEWDWNYGGVFSPSGDKGEMQSHAWVDNGTYTVAVRVTDDDGSMDVAEMEVTVNNLPPIVDAGPDKTVNEGDSVSFNGSYTDPGLADTHTILWEFWDGGKVSGTLTPSQFCADDGVYPTTLTVTDDDGGAGSDTATVTVRNVAPVVTGQVNQTPIECNGDPVQLDATFTDPGPEDTHIARIAWGDGSGESADIQKGGSTGQFTGDHVYSEPGSYPITAAVKDDDGGEGQYSVNVNVIDSTPPNVVIHNPQVIWPPNHKYVTFNLSDCATVSDACDPNVALADSDAITYVTSDEPQDAQGSSNKKNDDGGDGHTLNDMVIVDKDTVKLRAERLGGGDGRVYTIHFVVEDASGNKTSAECKVYVPHDQRPDSEVVDSGAKYTVWSSY